MHSGRTHSQLTHSAVALQSFIFSELVDNVQLKVKKFKCCQQKENKAEFNFYMSS